MSYDLNMDNFMSMVDNIITGIVFFEYDASTKDLKFVFANEGLFRMLGYSRVQGTKYIDQLEKMIIPDDIPIMQQCIADILRDDGVVETEFRTVTAQGSLRWLSVRGNLYSLKDNYAEIVCIVSDITEKKSIEEELQLQAERLHILSEAEGEKIVDYNAKTDVLVIKNSSDYTHTSEIIIDNYGSRFSMTVSSEDLQGFSEVFKGMLKSPKHDSFDFRTDRFDPEPMWYQANLTSLLGPEGYVTRIVGRVTNIHEKKLKEIDLTLRAEKDALTGLYNKAATISLVNEAIEADKESEKISAFMIIDLDNFKEVNDYLGHSEGDRLLTDTGEALSNIFKGADIVGRIGGDEFVVLMRNLNSIANADVLSRKVMDALTFNLPYEDSEINVTCSIGISIYPYHGMNYDTLLEKADKALYTVKANGKGNYRIFDAATTMVYHANRKSLPFNPEKGMTISRNTEDLIMQVLYEDKDMQSALSSVIELLTIQYNCHVGYICFADDESESICFCTPEYGMGNEKEARSKLREVLAETLYTKYKTFTTLHDYDLTTMELNLIFRDEGIQALLYYPITSKGKYKGAIILENHEQAQFTLNDQQDEEIRSLFRIVEAHILQLGILEKLQDFVTHISLLDNLDSYVYIVNADSYELAFINKRVLTKSTDVKIGDICYEAIANRKEPCENCILKHLDKSDAHSRYSEEKFNYSLRCWTKCCCNWFSLSEDNPLALLNNVDISDYFLGS